VILAGDEFRRLLRDGYRDSAGQAGAGLTRTHPADIFLPPLLAVDHVLTGAAWRRRFERSTSQALTTERWRA
jgi:hypothetical protein